MTHLRPLDLAGGLVRLREFAADDLDAVAAIVGDDRVTTFLSFDSRTREQAESMLAGILDRAELEPRTEFYLAVEPLAGPPLVGFIRLALGGVRAAKLGYAIHADHWGRGYATDALRTMIAYAWDVLDLHRITAAIGPENAASIAVVERVGMVPEGRLRDHVFTNGAWRDSLLHSVLRDDPVPPA
ncbi:GNAT family N-acetyltransferase [Microlunatus parietis]|uniref:RimJ/RimL family protein N-acetyltransferase n=1 Tax=Microlunatus parietis TaxID=682979 RepID=A0A7Y9LB62_9ACTN|nr:GNAT family protein [Microlunatus parietis]NYE70290.1 RimJ/RimL family protein N-acetyltransferase [Microlunatus parietis]